MIEEETRLKGGLADGNKVIRDEDLELEWVQHFPTYTFKDRSIALEEYRSAARILESEERVFLNASNVVIIAFAGLGSLAVGKLDKLTSQFKDAVPEYVIIAFLLLLTYLVSSRTMRYFAHRQKTIVYATRKVIVLRRMLGLSYGNFRLVLPNWRVEGADEPFAIRLFPGWNTYVTLPFYLISAVSAAVVFFFVAAFCQLKAVTNLLPDQSWPIVLGVTTLWLMRMAYSYRKALLDTHGRMGLLLTRHIARTLGLGLVNNFEYTIYRANLARFELLRLGVELDELRRQLIHIEDRAFIAHRGVSLRALGRAFLGVVHLKRRSGGSTITQQLSRTLFIRDLQKLARRKLIEILLALWFDRVIEKEDQIQMYLASVRFERHTYGILAAMRYYFGDIIRKPSPAQAFFLVERISNVRSQLLASKIRETVSSALEFGTLNRSDVSKLEEIYATAITEGKISDPSSRVSVMFDSLKAD